MPEASVNEYRDSSPPVHDVRPPGQILCVKPETKAGSVENLSYYDLG